MDRKSSRTTTALVIAGVAALSAVALYFVAKFDRKVLVAKEPFPIMRLLFCKYVLLASHLDTRIPVAASLMWVEAGPRAQHRAEPVRGYRNESIMHLPSQDTKKTPKEVDMSTVPEDKQDEEDKGAAVAPPELVQAAQHSRVDADTAKPPAQTTTAPASKPQGATAAVMSKSMAAETPAAVTNGAEPRAGYGSGVAHECSNGGEVSSAACKCLHAGANKQQYNEHGGSVLLPASAGDTTAVVAWRQTGEEVTLEAACPADLRRKDVLVTFTTHSVHVEARGQVIADGQLFAPIAPDECCWEFGAPACPFCSCFTPFRSFFAPIWFLL